MNQKKSRVRFAPSSTGHIDLKYYRSIVFAIWDTKKIKGQKFFMPLRVAVTGQVEGRELEKVLPIPGKEVALERIDRVIADHTSS